MDLHAGRRSLPALRCERLTQRLNGGFLPALRTPVRMAGAALMRDLPVKKQTGTLHAPVCKNAFLNVTFFVPILNVPAPMASETAERDQSASARQKSTIHRLDGELQNGEW